MKKIHWLILVLAAVFVVLQLIPNRIPEKTEAGPEDLFAVHQVPEPVAGRVPDRLGRRPVLGPDG